MTRKAVIGLIIALALTMGFGSLYAQPTDQQGGWYCPWCSRGGGMGHGMMHHRGWCMGPQHGHPATRQGKIIPKGQAKTLLEHYLQSTKNPNLKLGNISEKETFYEAEILTKDGSLVDKIQVNKYTGWFRSAY